MIMIQGSERSRKETEEMVLIYLGLSTPVRSVASVRKWRMRRRRRRKRRGSSARSIRAYRQERNQRERRSKWVVFGDVVEMLLCSSLDLTQSNSKVV